jgi:hypothetical protein
MLDLTRFEDIVAHHGLGDQWHKQQFLNETP